MSIFSAPCLQEALQFLISDHCEGVNFFYGLWCEEMVLSIFSPIFTYRKFTQGKNFLPFLFSLKFLLLQSTLRQFPLPFVCFSGTIFLPASLCQFLFQVLHFPLLFLTCFFLPQEIPSTVLVIIFECNNDIPLYAHSELIKYVAAISTNN